jgi:hypothetical protein
MKLSKVYLFQSNRNKGIMKWVFVDLAVDERVLEYKELNEEEDRF